MVRNNTFATSALGRVACLSTAFTLCLAFAGCGGTGSTITPPPPVTVSSVSITCAPTSITTEQTSTCSATVTYSDGTTDGNVTWSATGGSVSAGVFTPSAAGSATVTATSVKDSTKSKTATITVSAAVTVSSVSITCAPTSITTEQTSTCSATVTYSDGTTDGNVTWSATGGSVSAGVFTPSAAGSATVTATSVKDSTKSKTATITVSVVAFQITGGDRYADADIPKANIPTVFTYTGCQQGDLLHDLTFSDLPDLTVPSCAASGPTTLSFSFLWQPNDWEPTWNTYEVQRSSGGVATNQWSTAFLSTASESTAVAPGPDGPYYQVQQITGQVYSETAGGKPTIFVPHNAGNYPVLIAVDDITKGLVYTGVSGSQIEVIGTNGITNCYFNTGLASISSIVARGGLMAFADPVDNILGIAKMDCTGFVKIPLAGQPWSVAMTGGVENAIYVVSRDTCAHALPCLTKFDFTGKQEGSALDLPNVTPESTVRATNPYLGVWQVAALNNSKVAAVLFMSSNSDGLVTLVDTDTSGGAMSITGNPKTGDLPFLIVPDDANNVFWVNYISAENGDPVTNVGEVTPSSNAYTPGKAAFPSGMLAGGTVAAAGNTLVGAMDSSYSSITVQP